MSYLHNSHSDEILRHEFLDVIGLSQNRLGSALGVPANRIHAIVKGTHDNTADSSFRLSKFFGLSEGYFLCLQNTHDTLVAKRSIATQIGKIVPWKKSPHSESVRA